MNTLKEFADGVVHDLRQLDRTSAINTNPENQRVRLSYNERTFVLETGYGSNEIVLSLAADGPPIKLASDQCGVNLAVRYIRTWAGWHYGAP